jgi:hypothetical protein
VGIVEQFLGAMAAHDWPAMSACVTDDIHRVGPYGDTYDGKQSYVAFIAGLLPSLAGYLMEVERVTYAGDGLAFAELAETVEMDGHPLRTPEVLVFGLTGAEPAEPRIRTIDIYIQTRPPS